MPDDICGDPGLMNHAEAVAFFNRLIADLKLREAGEEHDPITMGRLRQASAHVQDIAECVRHVPVRRAGGEWRKGGGGAEYEVDRKSTG